jgi:beta-ribofuranosylaminobenzene 5'-phosphate synthase
MNKEGYRINGGIGFTVKNPSLTLRFSPSAKFRLDDMRSFPLLKDEILRIKKIVAQRRKVMRLSYSIKIEIEGDMPTHFGFGSSTAIRLACLEALHLLNGRTPEREQLALSSGRGGTSGIGINTYFDGGLVIDLGRRSGTPFFCPSQLSENRKTLPLMMQRIKMPDWEVGICIPHNIPNKSEKEEADFFRRTCPIPSRDVCKTLYEVIYGLYSAIREKDKETFCLAIQSIQQCAWKLSERRQYGKTLTGFERRLYKCGAEAVGMSSLGPSLFFLAHDVKSVVKRMVSLGSNAMLLVTKPSNNGRSIVYV